MYRGKRTSKKHLWLILGLTFSFLLLSTLACTMGGLLSDTAGDEDVAAVRESENEEDQAASDVDSPADEAENDGGQAESSSDGSESDSIAPPAEQGGCTNVLYPMVLNQQWIYQITSEGETSKFGMTVSDVRENGATVDMLAYETGVTTSAEIECENGEILNFPNMMLGFLFGDVDGDIELEHIDGVYAPSYETFEANDWEYKWETEYLASGQLTAVSEGEMLNATLDDSPVRMEWESEGERETVEVEAGTFENAYVIDRKTEFEAALTLDSDGEIISLEGTVILETRLWFVPFQGLIRQEVTRTQLKLGPATFPLESDTVVELVEFYAAE